MRLRSLDSLRGILALVVVFHHCLLTVPGNAAKVWTVHWWLLKTPLRLIADGPSAVLLFFVLSGFVLAMSMQGRPGETAPFSYPRFAVNRFMRIYPPFAFGIFLSAALYLVIEPHRVAGLSVWFNTQSWGYPVTPGLIAGHLLMTDQHRDMSLMNVMWTLVHILRISLLFPLIYFALRARPVLTFLALAALSAAANLALSRLHLPPVAQTLCGTSEYVVMFAAGALLQLNQARISGWMAAGGPLAALGLTALGLGLYLVPRTLPVVAIWAPGAAAAAIVTVAFAGVGAGAVLEGPVLNWLGKISYSLYLVHLPILLSLFHLFGGHTPPAVLVAATLMISLAVAALTQRWIETPSSLLGRRLVGFRPARAQPMP